MANRTYSFEQLLSLVAKDMGLEEGEYHCNLEIKNNDLLSDYNFTFSEPKGDALDMEGEGQ